eukprot:5180992-Amphidinium_carterae.1
MLIEEGSVTSVAHVTTNAWLTLVNHDGTILAQLLISGALAKQDREQDRETHTHAHAHAYAYAHAHAHAHANDHAHAHAHTHTQADTRTGTSCIGGVTVANG